MVVLSPFQEIWRRTTATDQSRAFDHDAVHFSFSSNPHFVYVVRANSTNGSSLVVLDIFTGRKCELKFRAIRTANGELSSAEIIDFEECGENVGIINYRDNQQNFGAAICTLDFEEECVNAFEVTLPQPHIEQTSIRRAFNEQVYLLDSASFASYIYRLNDGRIESTPSLKLHYDVRQRLSEIDGVPEDFMCINDGIEKTCCELSVYLANLQTGLVNNYATKLAEDNFPFKCRDRLVDNMQTAPFGQGVIAMFGYESRESHDEGLYAFAYLDLQSLQWTNLQIQLSVPFAHFQIVDKSTLMIMAIDKTKTASPILRSIYRTKIGITETLQHICYHSLLQTFPIIRSMTDKQRRLFGIPPVFRRYS
ncbi:hypothetical protein M3Y95_00982600 [Aphelenchoides besseyi]|nr:hypothetical protein M3Y95_00982600 [Aphelenchoides besseyi]